MTCNQIRWSPGDERVANLDCREYNASVDMLELWNYTFTNVFAFFLVLSNITCQSIEDGDATPFGTFIEGDQ